MLRTKEIVINGLSPASELCYELIRGKPKSPIRGFGFHYVSTVYVLSDKFMSNYQCHRQYSRGAPIVR